MIEAQRLERSRQEALRDDRDAFGVVVGSKTSVLGGEVGAGADVKDITIDYSVFAKGKELLKNTSVKISHGKRYGLVGPNEKGKSTLLKLLAWRKIPVATNIGVVLVEQEVVGDEKSAVEAVVSRIRQLMNVRREREELRGGGGEQDEVDSNHGGLQVHGGDATAPNQVVQW